MQMTSDCVSSQLWQPIGDMSLACWDNQSVVYHHASGNTYLIDYIPFELLKKCLLTACFTKDGLVVNFEAIKPDLALEDIKDFINQLLADLKARELIELKM